jgi:hypothetical protein
VGKSSKAKAARARRENEKHGLDQPTFTAKTGYGPGRVVERPEMLNKPSAKLLAAWERELSKSTRKKKKR